MAIIIPENETITSLDINFSNGGGSHSASIQTVLNAKDLSASEAQLGSLIGSKGGRTTFSHPQIQDLMCNFIEIEVSTQQNGTSKTKSRKYEDITSLKLKSHCILVRGKDTHPHDKALSSGVNNAIVPYNKSDDGQQANNLNAARPDQEYSASAKGEEAILPYFGELPNSPITHPSQRFPKRSSKMFGGVIIIGNIYNEESSVTSSGRKTSLVYQDKKFKEKLSYNDEYVNPYYKNNPDLANYNLKFGYTVKELKEGLANAGITVVGLPESVTDEVLFEESGTLDSILSTVAAKFGYYWFVEPFQYGVVRFVNSASASSLTVTNPFEQSAEVQKSYVDASYSENFMQPKIVNAFSSSIEKSTQTFEFGTGTRSTQFEKADAESLITALKIDKSLYKLFYGLYLAGRWEEDAFNALAVAATLIYKDKIEWGEWWEDHDLVGKEAYSWEGGKAFGDTARKKLKENDKIPFELEKGKYIRLNTPNNKDPELPSKGKLFGVLKDAFDIATNAIYVSNKFGEWKARRMEWSGSAMSITGPYVLGGANELKLSEIDDLSSLNSLFVSRGVKDKKVGFLFEGSNSSGGGKYGFLGKVNNSNRIIARTEKKDIDYDLVNPKNIGFFNNHATNDTYFGYTEKFEEQVKHLLKSSIAIWDEAMGGDSNDIPNTIKANFTRAKRPTDLEENEKTRKQAEADARRQSKLDAAAERLSEVSERFDIKYYCLKNNGASGNPLNPISLDAKSGTISDILALEKSNISMIQSTEPMLRSSSRTIVGLSIPDEFRITISGISLRLGGSGVTTTISESSKKILPPDQQIIIDKAAKVSAFSNIASRFSAGQKNYLGL